MWYASNIFFNIYNKQVLSAFPHATTCTAIHLAVAVTMLGSLWLFKLKKAPRIRSRTVKMVFPLGVLHLAGFLTTNMSLGAVNVSLTHTIKSLEPFFTVMLSFFFFGTLPPLPVLATLVPIVAGVIVASATDLSFNWYGFLTAMGSNLAFQSRNVLSKKYMVESSLESLEGTMDPDEVLDEVDLFLCISAAAMPLALVAVWALDGASLVARWAAEATLMSPDVFGKTLMAGACRTADVFASYALLQRLNPVTHSVANCVKRVVVIAVSIIFFKTQSSYLNILGTVMALSGVFAYSMAERMTKKKLNLPGQEPLSPYNAFELWARRTSAAAMAGALALMPSALQTYLHDKAEAQQEEEAKAIAKQLAEEADKIKAKEEQQPEFFL